VLRGVRRCCDICVEEIIFLYPHIFKYSHIIHYSMKSTLDNMRLLGIPSNVAKVLAVLSDGKPHSLRDIEKKGDVRQGEASIAVNALTSYLTVKTRDAVTRGRPQKIVVMSRISYTCYIEACVDCYKAAYEVAVDARKELLEE